MVLFIFWLETTDLHPRGLKCPKFPALLTQRFTYIEKPEKKLVWRFSGAFNHILRAGGRGMGTPV